MKKQITKLNSEELLEVSGGRENYVKRSWAKKFDPVDLDGEEKKEDSPKSVDDDNFVDEGGE